MSNQDWMGAKPPAESQPKFSASPMVMFLAYGLLALGAAAFLWPFLWMVSTSFKVEGEMFSERRGFFPEAPSARVSSPYFDTRLFAKVKGPRKDELGPRLRRHIAGLALDFSADGDREEALDALADGAYRRLLTLMPRAFWEQPLEKLETESLRLTDLDAVKELRPQLRRSLLLANVIARSWDLQEEELLPKPEAARRWKVEGPARLVQGGPDGDPHAELRYDFSSSGKVVLSSEVQTSFDLSRLYRLQLTFRNDDTWHSLVAEVEKDGVLLRAERAYDLVDSQWSGLTLQEPGPDDLSNKIKSWFVLKKISSGPEYESRPRHIKLRLVLEKRNKFTAWAAKLGRNYRMVFDNIPFFRYVATSIFLVLLNLFGTVASCSLVGYAFSRLQWPGRNLSFGLMLATMMIPSQVTMIPFFLIVRTLGWYNTLYPLWVGSFCASAFHVFLLHQFFKGIPRDIEDAAKIDGCGPLRIYWYIMLPLMKPALATIAIFTFMGVWNDFMGPLIYLSDQRLYPLSLGLYAFNVQAGSNMAMMMAGSFLMTLPVILLFFFAQRYFIQGIAMTGMKE